jgi:preprotein translocase SecE subunit
MKKVSWSSRKEVIGSTKVVIVTSFILAGVLFAVDILLTIVFHKLKVIGT